jgi:ABC-type branched-subunit amino acid transport system ATPase component
VLDAVGGDVHFCGEKISRIAPHHVIRKGIALVPEGRGVFPRLTVWKTCAWAPTCATTGRHRAGPENGFRYFPA